MITKLITTDGDFYALKNDWERLQEQDPDITYYSTFEYNKIWWDVYKNDKVKSLFIICAYQNNKIAGIAPLIIEKVSRVLFSYKTLKFMGRGDYFNFLIERKDNNEFLLIKNILEQIVNNNDEFDRIQLTQIKHDSILAAYLMRHKEFNENFNNFVECPIFNKNNYKNYEDFKRSSICPNVNRYVNKLGYNFKYKFIALVDNNDGLTERLSQIHIKEQRFLNEENNNKTRKSLFNNKKIADFIKKIYNKNKNTITFLLESEDRDIIIYSNCYYYKRILYSWNTAYNVKYKKYCAGKVLIYEIIKYLFESNFADIYDFGAGRYPWKFEWTNYYNINYKLYMWNTKTLKGKILKFLYKIKESIVIK
jgi:hypothetical protein